MSGFEAIFIERVPGEFGLRLLFQTGYVKLCDEGMRKNPVKTDQKGDETSKGFDIGKEY